MKYLNLILSICAVIGVVLLFQRSAGPDRTKTSTQPAMSEEHRKDEELEVAVIMGRIQRFHEKFWASVDAGNKELAGFYLHEMEEAMDEIAKAGIMEDGIDVSANMRIYGLDMVEHLEKILKDQGVDGLRGEAVSLINSCNTCHQASGYSMINIKRPEQHYFPDQSFEPISN